MADLLVNTARLSIKSSYDEPVSVFWQSDECYQCPLQRLFTVSLEDTANTTVLSTFYSSATVVRVGLSEILDCGTPSLGNQAEYLIQVLENKSCYTSTVTPATNEYHPLIAVVLAQMFFIFVIRMGLIVHQKWCARDTVASDEDLRGSDSDGNVHGGTPTATRTRDSSAVSMIPSSSSTTTTSTTCIDAMTPPSPPKQQESLPVAVTPQRRVQSLDTFRGLSLFIMVFVNYGGGKLAVFEHVPWNGLSVADLVFPWFVWIMGVSLAISMRSIRRKRVSTIKIFMKIVSRSVKLFAIGLVLNSSDGNNDVLKLRIPGVLQRFAISYFVVATMHLFWATPTDVTEGWRGLTFKMRDVIFYWPEWILMSVLVIIHVAITLALPVPGCPTGYVGPGGLYKGGAHFNCTGGAAGYIDRLLLGSAHIYQDNTANEIYHGTIPHDPEGILGCLTSIFLTFLGLQAGKILLTYRNDLHRISRWISWAIICGLAAGALCGFSREGGPIPVNKNLWSLSYVLCMASFAFLLLTAMYVIIDVMNLWSGGPFIYLGMNSILVYVGHSLVTGMLPWSWVGPETHWNYLIMNLTGTYLWTLTAYILHKNEVYLAL